jgi:hypothetical protein
MTGEFSVCQFFKSSAYEYVRRFVGPEEAVKAAHLYTHNVGAKLGMVERVIITDGDDYCCFEARRGRDLPTRSARAAMTEREQRQFTADELAREAQREAIMRESVFANRVAAGRMKPQEADRRIRMMLEIASRLRAEAEKDRLL